MTKILCFNYIWNDAVIAISQKDNKDNLRDNAAYMGQVTNFCDKNSLDLQYLARNYEISKCNTIFGSYWNLFFRSKLAF